jgi:hypothetical protein
MAKLPFGMLPGHWGLAGRTREIAKAEYELEGYELEQKLLSIKSEDFTVEEIQRKCADIDFEHKKITEPEYHRRLAELIKDEKQKTLAILELDWREGKITELEYQKTIATLKDEPWVIVLNMDFGGKSALEGSFELDWNEQFVAKLKAEGYVGVTDDVVVNQWFMEVCRNVAMEEFDGTGDFTADSEANLDAVKRWSADSKSFGEGRKGYR